MIKYTARLRQDGIAVVHEPFYGRDVATIHGVEGGKWRTKINPGEGVNAADYFPDTDTWPEAARKVASWGGDDVEIVTT
jgi:hypothetical protein